MFAVGVVACCAFVVVGVVVCCLLIVGRCFVVVCRCVVFVNTEVIHGEYKRSNVIVGCRLLVALAFVVWLLLFAVC